MNRFKLNLGMVAVIAGLATAVAFKAPAETTKDAAQSWFLYNGGGVSNPMNYTEISGTPSCDGDAALCAILAEEDGNSGKPTQAGVNHPVDSRKFD